MDKASWLEHNQYLFEENKTRRLMMVMSYRPILTVETIPKGIIGRATNAAMRRVVDGVCGHGHGEVLMDGKGN